MSKATRRFARQHTPQATQARSRNLAAEQQVKHAQAKSTVTTAPKKSAPVQEAPQPTTSNAVARFASVRHHQNQQQKTTGRER